MRGPVPAPLPAPAAVPFTPRGVYLPSQTSGPDCRAARLAQAAAMLVAALAEAALIAVFIAGVAAIALAVDAARIGGAP